ncbi:MAG: YqeG family HAD IIIA-type phosphatase [Olsenella sp.]|nr:YqeG family HAD IIIA-type phosphatase [Olsenella sp.]
MGVFDAWRYFERVDQIPVDELVEQRVRCVLVDRDNTCVPRDTKVAPVEVTAWLEDVRSVGIRTCIVSNNFHSAQVEESARELGCDVVHHAMKPAPFALRRALELEGVSAAEAVMIGDQVFTDVVAGNLARVRTILVKPQSRRDLWYTQIMRLGEGLVLRGRTFEGDGRG